MSMIVNSIQIAGGEWRRRGLSRRQVLVMAEVRPDSSLKSGDFFRLPLVVEDGQDREVKRVEAVGFSETPKFHVAVSLELAPGDYWIKTVDGPEVKGGFRILKSGEDPLQLCRHVSLQPTVTQNTVYDDSEGRILYGVQRWTIQACCREGFAKSGSGQSYGMVIYAVLKGALALSVDGQFQTVREGEYAVTNPASVNHPSLHQRFPISLVRLYLGQGVLRRFRESMGLKKEDGPFAFEMKPRSWEGELRTVFKPFLHERPALWLLGDRERFELDSRRLLLELVNHHPNPWLKERFDRGDQPKQDPRLESVLTYINRRYADPLTLDSVAREVGVSESWIRKEFFRVFRLGFNHHLQAVRVAKALEMLQRSKVTFQEVAHAVGYKDHRSFRRIFRQHLKIAPREVRRGNV